MENRMHFLKEQKIVIMCAKNRRWSRQEHANGNEFYYVSDPCKCRKAVHRLQQI